MDVHDIDENCFPPFSSELFTKLASSGSLPNLRWLTATISDANLNALKIFADSAFCLQLEYLWMEVRVLGTDLYEPFIVQKKTTPDEMRLELHAFINERSAVQ